MPETPKVTALSRLAASSYQDDDGKWIVDWNDVLAALTSSPVSTPEGEDATAGVELGEWMRVVREAIWMAWVTAHSHGYALTVHGSLRRDIDVVAVPWTNEAISPDELAEKIVAWLVTVEVCHADAWKAAIKTREEKPHGRLAWSISLKGPLSLTSRGECAPYLELSVVAPASPPSGDDTRASTDVLAERTRQKSGEGWTTAHDDEHADGSLAVVAACYVLPETERGSRGLPVIWPDSWHVSWWKPTPQDRRRELVKAGALVLAEIERLDRAASRPAGEGDHALAAMRAASPVSTPEGEDATAGVELGEWLRVVREAIWVTAHSHGYALTVHAVHGSLRRDIDVVAVPWTNEAISPDELAEKIVAWLVTVEVCHADAWKAAIKTREEKPHGRLAWSISLKGPLSLTSRGECAPYLELSVVAPASPPSGDDTRRCPTTGCRHHFDDHNGNGCGIEVHGVFCPCLRTAESLYGAE